MYLAELFAVAQNHVHKLVVGQKGADELPTVLCRYTHAVVQERHDLVVAARRLMGKEEDKMRNMGHAAARLERESDPCEEK